MHFSSNDRLLAGLACVYFCYRVVMAFGSGVYNGDGDLDVHATRNPGAFTLTIITGTFVAILCGIIALAPNSLAACGSIYQAQELQR